MQTHRQLTNDEREMLVILATLAQDQMRAPQEARNWPYSEFDAIDAARLIRIIEKLTEYEFPANVIDLGHL